MPSGTPVEQAILRLQGAIGNRAVTDILTNPTPLPPRPPKPRQRAAKTSAEHVGPSAAPAERSIRLPLGMTHPVASAMEHGDVLFRIPTFADLKAIYTDKTLNIPEATIKDRVAQLLGRMQAEKRLKSKNSVPDIIAKIFPGPGKIDEAEFNNALDTSDRTVIYQSVVDASTTVKPGDKAKLQAAMGDASALILMVMGDIGGLKAVFGSKAAVAKVNYGKARTALKDVSKDMDKDVSTDYNLDDPEVFLGGWANYGAKHMHLLVGIVKVTDPNETKATLIHEASHLADPSVDDHGYYGTPGFEAMTTKEKVGNAGHYEELPRRVMGTSSYVGITFTPGAKKGGAPMTHDDVIHRNASEYCRQAWDAAVDTHTWIRGVRKAALGGNTAPFTKDKALILEVSKLMDLTVHAQDPGAATVTALDITLTESIARGVSLVGDQAGSQPVPAAPMTDEQARDEVVKLAAAKYGKLLGAPARDKVLLDWLVAHYRSLPSAP